MLCLMVVQHLSLLMNILPHYVEYMLMVFVFLYCLYRYFLKLVHLIFILCSAGITVIGVQAAELLDKP